MPGRGRPRVDARRVKRKAKERQEVQKRARTEIPATVEPVVERVNLSLDEHDAQTDTNLGNDLRLPMVEEVFDINKIMDDNSGGIDPGFMLNIGNDELPSIERCADDDIAAHVPLQLKQKIWANTFINIALLLKGNSELSELFSGGLLHVSDDGKIEAKPRQLKEKVATIDKWTDAFLIFTSIYIQRHPEKASELLKYMFVIRDAAMKYPILSWRTYDEQFRIRQALQVSNWGKINPDLWMRIMASPFSPSQSVMKVNTCRDFNKGFCSFLRCRYQHSCDLCGSNQHGMIRCQTGKSDGSSTLNYAFRGFGANRGFGTSRGFGANRTFGAFRGFGANRFYRGYQRGARGGRWSGNR